jgi:hypothetical protein
MSNRIPPNYRPDDSSSPAEPPPVPSIAALRLIVTALIIGACVVGGTVLFSANRIGAKVFHDPMIAHVLVAVSALMLTVSILLGYVMKPSPDGDAAAHLSQFGAMTLARIGILEGAAVLNYVFYLLSQNDITLATGIVLVITMLILRPTQAQFDRWRNHTPGVGI